MTGVKITVTNRSNTKQNKAVTVNQNVVITNYPGDKMEANGLKIEVKDGKKVITGSTSDNKPTGNLRSADMANYKYTVFENLMKLDKNPDDLTQKDLDLVTPSMDGVKQVRRDKEAGVTTIVFDNGEILKFDFETDAEKVARLNAKKDQATAQVNTADNKNVQTIDPRSTVEKGAAAFLRMFVK